MQLILSLRTKPSQVNFNCKIQISFSPQIFCPNFEISPFNKWSTIKKWISKLNGFLRLVKMAGPNSSRFRCWSYRSTLKKTRKRKMWGYVGVYQSFSTWSYVDYKPFEGLKFVWSYFWKIWANFVSDTPKIFRKHFFEEDKLPCFGYAILKYIRLGLVCIVCFFISFFKIALWVQVLQSHSQM